MPRISPAAYRRITLFALLALAFIVVTGAAVRLTGSGLGCSDWPTCEQGQLAPSEITDAPAMIEFVNRLITGVVSVAVILAVAGARWRVPRRRDLIWLASGLVAGVVAQIVLGGLVVLFELSPRLVMGHFLLSMVIVWNAVALHHRAGQPEVASERRRARPLVGLGRLVLASAAVVVFTGTLVTASGPHAGDRQAERLDLFLPDVARIHGASVVVLLFLTLAVVAILRRRTAPAAAQRAARLLLAVVLAQGAVGYVQYFTGVPALLVGVHIVGALLVWTSAANLQLVLAGPGDEATVTAGATAKVAGADAMATT